MPIRLRRIRTAAVVGIGLVLAVSGCARRSSLMTAGAKDTLAAAPPDKAVVVFLRPEFKNRAFSAAVYEDGRFIGIVMCGARLNHETEPGAHRYMVVSEAADFLDATLDAGKLYFVRVESRMGVWRARFSLAPITPGGGEWSDLRDWVKESYPVRVNAEGTAWARDNDASVREKERDYLQEWLAKPASERPVLRPGDGVPAL